MRYFIIAGEASGDLHAASLISALNQSDPNAAFAFLGGDLMAEAAGCPPVIHYRDMAYMGFAEVLKHLPAIRHNFATARKAISAFSPHCLILIDYPSFNLKMAKYAKKLGIPVVYYISPKVWAWKQWRVKTIKKVVDLMLVIFPFEVDFYKKHGMDVTYVGNPSVEEIDRIVGTIEPRAEFIKRHKLPDKQYIALLPGSRVSEIRENLPVMIETVKQFPQLRAVIAGAPGIDAELYDRYTRINEYNTVPVVRDNTYAVLAHARAALVTSGTATLETALVGTPQVAMYQGGGSKLLYNIMSRVLKIKYVTLPNLIDDSAVIPEMLMHLCTPEATGAELGRIVPEGESRAAMLDGYARIRASLGASQAPARAAEAILSMLAAKDNQLSKRAVER